MEGVGTPSAASAVAVITALLWTLMKGIALVSNSAFPRLFFVFFLNEATAIEFITTTVGGISLEKAKMQKTCLLSCNVQ